MMLKWVSYTRHCCPNYLKPAHQPKIRANADRVRSYNSTLADFLICNPGPYTHFLLLDHQDWLAWHRPEALLEEWRQIMQNSQPGTKILLRSASLEIDFLPPWVEENVRLFPEITRPLNRQDRVGTYGSLHLAEVL